MLAAVLGACLPDADKPALLFLGRSPFPAAVDRIHTRIQHESPHRLPREVRVAAGLAMAVAALTGASRRAAR